MSERSRNGGGSFDRGDRRRRSRSPVTGKRGRGGSDGNKSDGNKSDDGEGAGRAAREGRGRPQKSRVGSVVRAPSPKAVPKAEEAVLIDREKRCPFLLRVFIQAGEHHQYVHVRGFVLVPSYAVLSSHSVGF